MSKDTFDLATSIIIRELQEEAEKIGVGRVNSTMLLRALLEADESPLYDALMAQVVDFTIFPEMIDETYAYLPDSREDEEESEEKEDGTTETEKSVLPQITYLDQGKMKTIYFDEDLAEVIGAIATCSELEETVTTWSLTAFLVQVMPHDVRMVLRTFGIKTSLLKTYFSKDTHVQDEEVTGVKLPGELRSFVRDLNAELKDETCDISGRDRECNLVWQTMMKQTKRNVALIGEPGVGKTSIVVKMVHDILNETCPKEFKALRFLRWMLHQV